MLEIERKFLLDALPALPDGTDVWQIDQGYLAPAEAGVTSIEEALASPYPSVGRIRRIVFPDGSIICTHAIKIGSGMMRDETQRTITIESFEQLWPQTATRRLRKWRHRVHDRHGLWEIDQFAGTDLVLAEIELVSPDSEVHCPEWLERHVVKEVTNDPNYTNAAIAMRLSRE